MSVSDAANFDCVHSSLVPDHSNYNGTAKLTGRWQFFHSLRNLTEN
ncbi:hypothetical protein [Paenibacillus sp. 1_12]|nr:hypothetical protein [Paenibacillus sp. 1_12]